MNVWCPICGRQHEFRRSQADRNPVGVTFGEVWEIVVGVPIFLTLFIGIPLLIWLVAS
jgi:hypothetical protein